MYRENHVGLWVKTPACHHRPSLYKADPSGIYPEMSELTQKLIPSQVAHSIVGPDC